jgi:hypothetical protein
MVQQIEGKSIGKKSLLVLLKLLLPTGEKPNPPAGFPPLSFSPKRGEDRGRSLFFTEGGALLPSPCRRLFGGEVLGLALFIGILLLSESVGATPTRFSPLVSNVPPYPMHYPHLS